MTVEMETWTAERIADLRCRFQTTLLPKREQAIVDSALAAFQDQAETLARVRQYCQRVLAAPTTEYEFNVGKDTVAQSVLDELALLPSGSPEAVPAKEKP